MKKADVLGFIGVGVFGASLWAIHPAVTCAFGGLMLVACAVFASRAERARAGQKDDK